MTAKTSPATQDYLKSMYLLEERENIPAAGISTSALAEHLGVSAASATNMLKRLEAMALVTYVPYRGAELTEAGRKVALEVIRHHRLLETYLAEALDVPWDEVHEEAEVLEHVLSERLEERISRSLGDPSTDPHGHPIPPRDGDMELEGSLSLSSLHAGERGVVAEVSDRDPEVLRYLGELGMYPGVAVQMVARAPFDGPLTVRIDGVDHHLGPLVASHVYIASVARGDAS